MNYLKGSCAEIFEQELERWDRVEYTWPKDRSFEAFKRWSDFNIGVAISMSLQAVPKRQFLTACPNVRCLFRSRCRRTQ
jgi:hypothetical protein